MEAGKGETEMKTKSFGIAGGVAFIILLGAAYAADLKVASPAFNRGTFFRDNGNVKPLGRVFQNVGPGDMPGLFWMTGGPLEVRNSSGTMVSAIEDNYIFLTSTALENQTSFPGKTKVSTVAGGVAASFDDAGKMYVRGVIEHVASCVAPVWESSKWNTYQNIQLDDNCYNYGNNQPTYTFAQPGKASGATAASMSVTAVRQAALNDGLTWVGWSFPGNTYTCPGAGTLVFMTVAPGVDYHWYRLDKANGKWTHKPGGSPATDVDASGLAISNPLSANRNYGSLNYTDNGGFYCTCGSDANVR
jgi:hypothetical protein